MDKDKDRNLKFSDYSQKGLYLALKGLTKILLIRENIENITLKYWNQPDKISPNVWVIENGF